MEPIKIFFFGTFLIFLNCNIIKAQSETEIQKGVNKSYVVKFECKSCTERNKFNISGPEDHTFKAVKFPFTQELKPGEYEMTYWQNRVQQIHLPFSVIPDSENVIVVKD